MSCTRWHRRIALEVGGDLGAHHSRGLEKHLEGCAACRDLSEELRSQRQELLRLDRAAGDGVTLGSVRHAVLADLDARRGPVFHLPAGGRRLAFAGAAAVVLIVAAIVLRHGATTSQPMVAERRVPTVVSAPTAAPTHSPTAGAIVETPRAVQPPAPLEPVDHEPLRLARRDLPAPEPESAHSLSAPTEPMTVKILTDDPEVVIYWIVDPKGDKENA